MLDLDVGVTIDQEMKQIERTPLLYVASLQLELRQSGKAAGSTLNRILPNPATQVVIGERASSSSSQLAVAVAPDSL